MAGASIETTLEIWASSLRDVKVRIRPLFTQQRVAASAGLFLDGILGDERATTDGCVRTRRVTPARGANRLSWAEAAGMLMRCATPCGTMSLSICLLTTRFW